MGTNILSIIVCQCIWMLHTRNSCFLSRNAHVPQKFLFSLVYTVESTMPKTVRQKRSHAQRTTGHGSDQLVDATIFDTLQDQQLRVVEQGENVFIARHDFASATECTRTHQVEKKAPKQETMVSASGKAWDRAESRKRNTAKLFIGFLNRLPSASYVWRSENGVGTEHTPTRLSRHISESILVFSFRSKRHHDSTTTQVIGATMYRRNNRKKRSPMDKRGQLVVHVRQGVIAHTWTSWSPNACNFHMQHGIFVWLFRDYIARVPLEAQICVLDNEKDLRRRDGEQGLDWRGDFTHYVFAKNASFPPSSGW